MPFASRAFLPLPLIYRFDFQLERGKGRNSEEGVGGVGCTIMEKLYKSCAMKEMGTE